MEIIRLDKVSKCFHLRPASSRSFQELAISLLKHGPRRRPRQQFWALEDISFSVTAGETVGIIGANGSGKSTCLKLLTRIIEPTSGSVSVNGRVAALLELGAGFHPDLTGRENVFLYGAILGLRRRDMAARLDEIVVFAELQRFIDVPVKFYSSGMYVRLAFATAVHVNPDLLLVDEVLAVGDVSFQAKCLAHIRELQQRGVTILFVSHDLDEVRRLCRRAIWLHNGCLCADGPSDAVVQSYLRQAGLPGAAAAAVGEEGLAPPGEPAGPDAVSNGAAGLDLAERRRRRWGSGEVQITEVSFEGAKGPDGSTVAAGEPTTVVLRYRAGRRIAQPVFGLAIHRQDGLHVAGSNTLLAGLDIPSIEGEGEVRFSIRLLPLPAGHYYLTVAAHDATMQQVYDYQEWCQRFTVTATEPADGVVQLPATWELLATAPTRGQRDVPR